MPTFQNSDIARLITADINHEKLAQELGGCSYARC